MNGELASVFFINESTGFLTGDQGLILKTVNGGTTFTRSNPVTQSYLRSIYFIDIQTGWAAGEFGTIINTINGGD